ncbi:MAG: hypothetical protein JST83_18485 [Bacteroidetes bacterium]|nr:hypothetical protein [Bacteroidota bacterium]
MEHQKIFYKHCAPIEVCGSFRTWLHFHDDYNRVVYSNHTQYMQLNSILKLENPNPLFVYYLKTTGEAIVCEAKESGIEIVILDFKAQQKFSRELQLDTRLMLPREAIEYVGSGNATAFTQERIQKPLFRLWRKSILLQ